MDALAPPSHSATPIRDPTHIAVPGASILSSTAGCMAVFFKIPFLLPSLIGEPVGVWGSLTDDRIPV